MTELISVLSTGKGTWGHVNGLISTEKFGKVFLITNEFGKENFNANENTELLVVNSNEAYEKLRDSIMVLLKEKIKESEVAVNFISGTGKEHMALIGALIKLGIGFRLVVSTKEGIKEL
jgi:hypothetical protein